ncbi:hypothetical protein [Roseovarius sp. 217]|uniref:hypothetical protein n=1 Tax=Roseovarius sp. (strain 217) TaxID=314264 RepID=UPI00006853D7|nr:hypothetical protein [Roseovarius sp. 217]EAQ23454.1 hypothetical protein ROS217_10102 [Roseovarius sp. 217]
MKTLPLTLAACAALGATAAQSQEKSSRFSAEFSVELQSDFTVDSSAPGGEINNTFAIVEGALSFAFTSQTSINSTVVLEQITPPTSDSFLEDHGLYAEELYFAHDFGAAQVVLGKFNPGFGTAWDVAPGIYGVDFAEDYEITERIGAGLVIPFSTGQIEHELSVSIFNADRSVLSESLGENRGRTNRNDGGVSNTSGPESFSIALSGTFGATAYNLGLQSQARGVGDVEDQNGIVGGVSHEFGSGSMPVTLLAEVAYFDHFDGTADSATFATVGVEAPVGPVTLSAVYALRDVETLPRDHLATLSGEIEILDGLSAALAYRYGEEGGDETHTIGALLAYAF